MNSENVVLMLRPDGSIVKYRDGSAIIKLTTEGVQRLCLLHPVRNRTAILQVFGPWLYNRIIAENDGSSTSGLYGPHDPIIWNETTVLFLLECLALHKWQFLSNTNPDALYETIAMMMNSRNFEHRYTSYQCEQQIRSLLEEYTYQLLKNYNFEGVKNDTFLYFDTIHEIFGDHHVVPDANRQDYSNLLRDGKFEKLLNDLRVKSLELLGKHKNSSIMEDRIDEAFRDLFDFIIEMRGMLDYTTIARDGRFESLLDEMKVQVLIVLSKPKNSMTLQSQVEELFNELLDCVQDMRGYDFEDSDQEHSASFEESMDVD